MKSKACLSLITWIVLFEIIAAIMGYLSNASQSTWYQTLPKSPLTPPGYVFAIVWPILYIGLAYIGHYLFKYHANTHTYIKALYCVQMGLNFMWTPIFFICQLPKMALLINFLMILSTCLLIPILYKKNMNAFFCNLAYLGWICFAAYLNIYIVINI